MTRAIVICAWCGAAIERNAARMRLHETQDSSVRHTRMVLSFHPACGRALVDQCEARRELALSKPRRAWGRGPRAIGVGA